MEDKQSYTPEEIVGFIDMYVNLRGAENLINSRFCNKQNKRILKNVMKIYKAIVPENIQSRLDIGANELEKKCEC